MIQFILLMAGLSLVSLVLTAFLGRRFDTSRLAKNLDLTLSGLTKALIVGTFMVTLSATTTGSLSMAELEDFFDHHDHEVSEEQRNRTHPFANEGSTGGTTTTNPIDQTGTGTTQLASAGNGGAQGGPGVGASVYKDGIYQGTGLGFRGNLTMEVEVSSGEIVRVDVVDHVDDRKWFNLANKVIPDSIIANQSANVDVVSGATYTSYGMIEGAKKALEQSMGD